MTVFISRDLAPESDFQRILTTRGWRLRGMSLLSLTPLHFELPATKPDWVFFASAFGARCFFEGISPTPDPAPDLTPPPTPPPRGRGVDPAEGTLPSPSGEGWGVGLTRGESEISFPHFAALGPATAAALSRYIPKIDFTGTGDPAQTAAAFLPFAKGQTILFPAAKNSRRSVADGLEGHCTVLHLPVYDNAPLPDVPFLPEDVLVFTSPMNARAYLSKHRPAPQQTLIAIGATTAQTFRAFGVIDFLISPEAGEAALAESVLRSRT